jgi:PHD/YefM family antitoxin component YafN of YafNO toxin-antitoxin module
MISYTQQELASATELSKHFGDYISKVQSGELEKIGVLKNNKLNAVILSTSQYEKIASASELLEDLEIYQEVIKRKNNPNSLLDGKKVLAKHGLTLDV